MYKNCHFYRYFPKIRKKKSTSRPKKSTKRHIKKQLVKKKHKKAHVLFKSTLYEHWRLGLDGIQSVHFFHNGCERKNVYLESTSSSHLWPSAVLGLICWLEPFQKNIAGSEESAKPALGDNRKHWVFIFGLPPCKDLMFCLLASWKLRGNVCALMCSHGAYLNRLWKYQPICYREAQLINVHASYQYSQNTEFSDAVVWNQAMKRA